MSGGFAKHWWRLKRSLGRRWRELCLPRSYVRLGTRYGGWWLDRRLVGTNPLLIDCGLGEDISFPEAFLASIGGNVIGIEPNPRSLAYCLPRCPAGMEILNQAFWLKAGETLTFHLPRSQDHLPKGADGVSGSLVGSHGYVEGGELLRVTTIDLAGVLDKAGRQECDLLKLDIEGAEYEVLSHLAANGELRRAAQVLVEFHHNVTHHLMADTDGVVAQVLACGFRLAHTEGRNYIFRREGL